MIDNVWVIGGDPATYEAKYAPFGNPVLVTAWFDHTRSPASIVDYLRYAVEGDRLAIGINAPVSQIVFAVAIWFMQLKDCQLVFDNREGGMAAQLINKESILRMIELARAEKESRP